MLRKLIQGRAITKPNLILSTEGYFFNKLEEVLRGRNILLSSTVDNFLHNYSTKSLPYLKNYTDLILTICGYDVAFKSGLKIYYRDIKYDDIFKKLIDLKSFIRKCTKERDEPVKRSELLIHFNMSYDDLDFYIGLLGDDVKITSGKAGVIGYQIGHKTLEDGAFQVVKEHGKPIHYKDIAEKLKEKGLLVSDWAKS